MAKEVLGELESLLPEKEAAIEPLLEQLAAVEAKLPAKSEPVAPKFDPEKHPLLKKSLDKAEPVKAVTFNSGDICEAQWTDKNWYKAKIQTILGSASAPKYHVRFIEYDDTMTVDRTAVRPLPTKRKREPETASAPTPSAPVTSSHVISGPATTNPNAVAAKPAGTNEDMANKKPSRVPTKGTLKKRASAWADFQNKVSKKGVAKKESMFRSGTTVGSKGTVSVPRSC